MYRGLDLGQLIRNSILEYLQVQIYFKCMLPPVPVTKYDILQLVILGFLILFEMMLKEDEAL